MARVEMLDNRTEALVYTAVARRSAAHKLVAVDVHAVVATVLMVTAQLLATGVPGFPSQPAQWLNVNPL